MPSSSPICATASLLTALVNNAAATRTVASNYFEPINEGAIVVEQFSAGPTPLGSVLPLFGAYAGFTRVSTSPGSGDDDVVALAAVDTSTGAVLLTLSNRNGLQSFVQPVALTLPGGRSCAGNASVLTLSPSGLYQEGVFSSTATSVAVVALPGGGGCTASLDLPAYGVVQAQFLTVRGGWGL